MPRAAAGSYRFRSPSMYAIRPRMGKAQRHLGWEVALVRNRKRYQKYFANSRFGGRDSSLAEAKAWRDHVSRSMPCVTRAALSQLIRRHNTSGYPGAYLMASKRKTEKGERKHWMWQARTPQEVVPARTKSFSISRYGDDEAFALAVAARQEFVEQLGGRQWMHAIPETLRPGESEGFASSEHNH